MICLDASIAAKLIFTEPYSDRAQKLYQDEATANQRIVAPPLLRYEVTNVVRRRLGGGFITAEEAEAALDLFLGFTITFTEPPGFHRRALDTASLHALPAAYDAHYLVLAEALGCDFWTDDRELLRLVQAKLPFVRWIADYPAA
jgi:predicted nucleic acid-binding protein